MPRINDAPILCPLPSYVMMLLRSLWLRLPFLINLIGFVSLWSCSKERDAAIANDQFSLSSQACKGSSQPTGARCAQLEVPENYDQPNGSKLSVYIQVLPALHKNLNLEPVFVLAGGPGQAATEVVNAMATLLSRLRRNHDVVLIDQRGTGHSHPLECDFDRRLRVSNLFRTDFDLDQLKQCLSTYEVDPRNFTTRAFVSDLERVRQSLGYSSLFLYGVSYGTRAALAYLAAHHQRVAGVVLDGSAPPTIKIPLHFGDDGQAALEALFKDCAQRNTCALRFPNLRQRFYNLLSRLDHQPAQVSLLHPRGGSEEHVIIKRKSIASIARGTLYSTTTSALLPLAIDRAERGDFQLFAALADIATLTADSISFGLFLSIVCSEDIPWIETQEHNAAAKNTFLGDTLVRSLSSACRLWPSIRVQKPSIPILSDHAPVLLLSGALDPATPPRWGESIAAGLSNRRHIIFPQIGHGTWSTTCGTNLIATFFENKDLERLDDQCASKITRPPFFLNPLGSHD